MLKTTDKLYVTGGRQRKEFDKLPEEWHLYDRALILCVDPVTHHTEVCAEYETPADARPSELSSVLFKTPSRDEKKVYVCTSTEVLIYELPSFKQIGYVSLPCFNDLHHVRPTPRGTLLVAATGLDMVVEFTAEGEVLREWNVLGQDPWERFSKTTDYRKVATTKPHQSHPNFVFYLSDELWVTRFEQRDAISLSHPEKRIEIGIELVHDGNLFGGQLYFTTVDGHIVIVDPKSRKVVEVIDLKAIDNEAKSLLGWCRGLVVVDESKAWVGFTRVRNTKFKEKILWAKNLLNRGAEPARIALYDLKAKKKVDEINLEPYGMNVVFGMIPAAGS